MRFSVIIPAYNSAEFLGRCVGSLPASSQDLQIIVVDDGSTDSTSEVLAALKEQDPGLRVISQENKGVSAARNAGIAAASGDYLVFLDADDMLSPGAVNLLLTRDAVFGQDIIVMRSFAASERYPWKGKFKDGATYSAKDLMNAGYIRGSVCGCLFRLDFLRRNNHAFVSALSMAEDTVFFASLLGDGATVSFCDMRLYEVTQREDSASRNYDDDFISRYGLTLLAVRENVKDRSVADHTILSLLFGIVNVAIKMGYSSRDVRRRVDVERVLPLSVGSFRRKAPVVWILNHSFTLFFEIKKIKDKWKGWII